MKLTVYIEELLQKHNCVIVPNFGGFIANYKSAVIDMAKGRVVPPSKNILFNANLVNADGLLGNKIALSNTISYEKATDFIAKNVSIWQNELSEGKRVEIGDIGFLFKQNGQILFEQNREVNLLLNAYGLASVSFVKFEEISPSVKEVVTANVKPIETKNEISGKEEAVIITLDATKPIQKEAVAEEKEIIPIATNESIKKGKKRKVLKYLAVAAAIPFFFYSYWIPMETDFIDTGNIQMADFNPIRKAPDRNYQMRLSNFENTEFPEFKTWEDLTGGLSDNVEVYNYQFDDDLYIPVRLDKTSTDLPNEEATLLAPENTVAEQLIYHVIGGCFSVKENAENFVLDLTKQGFVAKILDLNNGLYRVTAGDFENRTEAKENLSRFKNQGFSGWILKK